MGGSSFSPAALQAAIHATVAEAEVPQRHTFATIVDPTGAHIALATRIGSGWKLDLNAGYDWTGKGFDGKLQIGKSW